jgi:hypothetical protein
MYYSFMVTGKAFTVHWRKIKIGRYISKKKHDCDEMERMIFADLASGYAQGHILILDQRCHGKNNRQQKNILAIS